MESEALGHLCREYDIQGVELIKFKEGLIAGRSQPCQFGKLAALPESRLRGAALCPEGARHQDTSHASEPPGAGSCQAVSGRAPERIGPVSFSGTPSGSLIRSSSDRKLGGCCSLIAQAEPAVLNSFLDCQQQDEIYNNISCSE